MKNFDLIINKGYNFDIGKDIAGGFELFKKDIGGFILATLLAFVMCIIPFCGIFAMGNFLKIRKKVDAGEKVQVGDIFDFQDFWMYFKSALLLLLVAFILLIPVLVSLLPIILATKDGEHINPMVLMSGLGIWFFVCLIGLRVFTISFYFVQPLISLYRIQSIRQAYSLSWKIAKKNFLMIFLFTFIVGFISQIGTLACGIRVLFTIPIGVCIKYISYKNILEIQNQQPELS